MRTGHKPEDWKYDGPAFPEGIPITAQGGVHVTTSERDKMTPGEFSLYVAAKHSDPNTYQRKLDKLKAKRAALRALREAS